MSDKDVVVLDEERPNKSAPTPKPKEEKPKVELKVEQGFGKKFFDQFGGKAPHYKLAGTFHIHDITKEEADNCRKFASWAKPKRYGLTVEFAEKMRKKGKLSRLELPWDD